jgi:hypothetical protein
VDCMRQKHREMDEAAKARIDAGEYVVTPNDPSEPDPLPKAYGGAELTDTEVAFMSDPVRFVNDCFNYYFGHAHWTAAATCRSPMWSTFWTAPCSKKR